MSILAGICLGSIPLFIGEVIVKRFRSSPEISRKIVHISACLIILSFPVLKISGMEAAVVSGIFAGVLYALNRRRLVGSIHRVDRQSLGEVFLVASIPVSYLLYESLSSFVAAYLVLAASDSIASVYGQRYGRHKWRILNEEKSVEGSAVFFLSAFLILFAVVFMNTSVEAGKVAILAALAALLAAFAELISRNGADNLVVPVVLIPTMELMLNHAAV